MKNKLHYIPVIAVLLIVVLCIAGNDNDKVARQQEFNNRYAVYALDLPDSASFAGEPVPLADTDVKERFDRELLVNTYWQSQTILLLKRKARWFAEIDPVLKANGIPEDFRYLMLAESGLTYIVSPAGASGYWQFLENTSRQYGLEINEDVDERYHPYKATAAACRYFNDAYAIFKSWTLVAASYNMGMDGIADALKKQQAKNYYDLLLSDETSRYLLRIVALKEICSNPLKYGFHLRERDYYQPYQTRTIQVDTPVTNLATFAAGFGMSYKTLKILNPWLRSDKLSNPANKNYQVLVIKNREPGIHPDTLLPSKEYHQE